MRILILVPSLDPGASGVGDHAVVLAGELGRRGHQIRLMALAEEGFCGVIEESDRVRLSSSLSWEERVGVLKKEIESYPPDWISLQLVCYGYHSKGLLFAMATAMRRLPKMRWHFLFHEIWIGAMCGSSFKKRLLGIVQCIGLVKLHQILKPRLCHTTNRTYQQALGKAHMDCGLLPLFGNFPPESAVDGPWLYRMLERQQRITDPRKNYWFFGIFGSLHPEWPPLPLLDHLLKAAGSVGKKIIILSIGRIGPGEALWRSLERDHAESIRWIRLGEMPAFEISKALDGLDFGIATTPLEVIGKSCSVMAMLEHGLPVIVNRRENYGLPLKSTFERDPLLITLDDDFEGRLIAGVGRGKRESRLPKITEQLIGDLKNAMDHGG